MDKAITTTFMVIASVVCTALVFNAVYPAVLRSRDAMISMKVRVDERLRGQIDVVHATGELDSSGLWQDINRDGDFDVFVWVKNVGSLRIVAVNRSDVFFGPEGNFSRIPHKDEAGGSYPYWEWKVENDSEWDPTATLKITIHFSSVLSQGRYFLKVVIPNGLSDEYHFSM